MNKEDLIKLQELIEKAHNDKEYESLYSELRSMKLDGKFDFIQV